MLFGGGERGVGKVREAIPLNWLLGSHWNRREWPDSWDLRFHGPKLVGTGHAEKSEDSLADPVTQRRMMDTRED